MSRLSANVGSFIGAVDDVRYPRLPVGRNSPSSMTALLCRSRRLDSSAAGHSCQSTNFVHSFTGRTIWTGETQVAFGVSLHLDRKSLMRNANDSMTTCFSLGTRLQGDGHGLWRGSHAAQPPAMAEPLGNWGMP